MQSMMMRMMAMMMGSRKQMMTMLKHICALFTATFATTSLNTSFPLAVCKHPCSRILRALHIVPELTRPLADIGEEGDELTTHLLAECVFVCARVSFAEADSH